jgi:hypothetical protein
MANEQIRRKVFISHYGMDRTAVRSFIDKWSEVFIPKEIGVYDEEDFINSTDNDYVMSKIRQTHLGDSTVTLVLLGTCTHSRRYIDWEIKSSLRQGNIYTPNGLLGIVLPSLSKAPYLPERFAANWSKENECYAEYHWAPSSKEQLAQWIEDAYKARTAKADLINNSQAMWSYNRICKNCNINHGI